MRVGVNLPWTASAGSLQRKTRAGWDFGEGPPGWWRPPRAQAPRLFDETAADLDFLVGLGVRDVRLFVLANGVNYPVGAHLGALCPPPPLTAAFLADFEALLGLAAARGVCLWPSLVSFELFGPLHEHGRGVTSGGRAPFVFGHYGSDAEIARFLDATLSPLLAIARRRSEAIGAFELVNEPEWVVRVLRRPTRPIPARFMRRFVALGVERIIAAGLQATVGFVDARAAFLDRVLVSHLARLGARGEYVHQLHHYPGAYRPRRLPRHADLPIRPCIVGELPTAMGTKHRSDGMRWQGRGLAEEDPGRFLEARLALIERLGYPGAFVWGLHADDEATSWAEGQAQQLATFLGPSLSVRS